MAVCGSLWHGIRAPIRTFRSWNLQNSMTGRLDDSTYRFWRPGGIEAGSLDADGNDDEGGDEDADA